MKESQARSDLAALFRACAMRNFHAGIDNHRSLASLAGRVGYS